MPSLPAYSRGWRDIPTPGDPSCKQAFMDLPWGQLRVWSARHGYFAVFVARNGARRDIDIEARDFCAAKSEAIRKYSA